MLVENGSSKNSGTSFLLGRLLFCNFVMNVLMSGFIIMFEQVLVAPTESVLNIRIIIFINNSAKIIFAGSG